MLVFFVNYEISTYLFRHIYMNNIALKAGIMWCNNHMMDAFMQFVTIVRSASENIFGAQAHWSPFILKIQTRYSEKIMLL
jgi:hypothetical protein